MIWTLCAYRELASRLENMIEAHPHDALQMTSPSNPNRTASLASTHSCSLFFVCTTATSPIPNGLTVCALLPLHILLISSNDNTFLKLGFDTACISFNTGRSALYLSSAQMRRSGSEAEAKAEGKGAWDVPRVSDWMSPDRRRTESMPRF